MPIINSDKEFEQMGTEHTSIFSLLGDRLSSLAILESFKQKIETPIFSDDTL